MGFAWISVALVGCVLITDLDGLSEGQGGPDPDGSIEDAGQEAGLTDVTAADADLRQAGAWCRSQDATLCEDFDDGPLDVVWKTRSDDPTEVGLTDGGLSPPSALRIFAPRTGTPCRYAWVRTALETASGSFRVAYAFRLVLGDGGLTVPVNTGVSIETSAVDGGGLCSFYLRVDPDARGHLVLKALDTPASYHTLSRVVDLDDWNTITVDLANRTMTVMIEDTTAATVAVPETCLVGLTEVAPAILCRANDEPVEVHFDNLVFEAR